MREHSAGIPWQLDAPASARDGFWICCCDCTLFSSGPRQTAKEALDAVEKHVRARSRMLVSR